MRVGRPCPLWLLAAVVAALLAACGSSAPAGDPWDEVVVVGEQEVLPVIISTAQTVGENRFAFALFDADGELIKDAQVRLRFFDLAASRSAPRGETEARYVPVARDPLETLVPHTHADESVHTHAVRFYEGIYLARTAFDRAGEWGVEVVMQREDGEPVTMRIRFQVRAQGQVRAVGSPAPRSDTPTRAEVADLRQITTDPNPEPAFYQLSIAGALDDGRPFVVAFATPAFCHSRTCGPVLEILKQVYPRYAGRVNFLHVEVFENLDDPDHLRDAPVVAEWGLPTEPWVFVVDARGLVAAAFEGVVTVGELEAALDAVLTGGE